MLNNQLMSDLDADEGLAEICVNEFIADTIKGCKRRWSKEDYG